MSSFILLTFIRGSFCCDLSEKKRHTCSFFLLSCFLMKSFFSFSVSFIVFSFFQLFLGKYQNLLKNSKHFAKLLSEFKSHQMDQDQKKKKVPGETGDEEKKVQTNRQTKKPKNRKTEIFIVPLHFMFFLLFCCLSPCSFFSLLLFLFLSPFSQEKEREKLNAIFPFLFLRLFFLLFLIEFFSLISCNKPSFFFLFILFLF